LLARLCAAIVGAVLAFAGANKVTSWKQWQNDAQRQNVPLLIAQLLPLLELVLGASLVVLTPVAAVLGAATLLLLIFTVYLSAQIIGKSQVPCACFGTRIVRPPAWRDVWRNLALIALLFASALLSS
jgi:uncharacterized membrane protein YphA (DoxX/SURF4 family)